MNTDLQFDLQEAMALKAILDTPDRPSGSLTYCQCAGFLFVVACSPELINPNRWIPVIMDDDRAQGFDQKKIAETMGLLVSLYNEINRQIQNSDVALVPGCEFRDDPMANFEDDAPLHQWALGFAIGHEWQNRLITQYAPKDLQDELAAQMMVLTFYTGTGVASSIIDENTKDGVTIESMAGDMENIFPDAMKGFAHMAHTIQQVLQEKESKEKQPAQSEKVGRNESCPCGSGKKYKKCCGSVLH